MGDPPKRRGGGKANETRIYNLNLHQQLPIPISKNTKRPNQNKQETTVKDGGPPQKALTLPENWGSECTRKTAQSENELMRHNNLPAQTREGKPRPKRRKRVVPKVAPTVSYGQRPSMKSSRGSAQKTGKVLYSQNPPDLMVFQNLRLLVQQK